MRKVAIAVNTRPGVRGIFKSKHDPKVNTETARGDSHSMKIEKAAKNIIFVIHVRSVSRESKACHRNHTQFHFRRMFDCDLILAVRNQELVDRYLQCDFPSDVMQILVSTFCVSLSNQQHLFYFAISVVQQQTSQHDRTKHTLY